MVQQVKLLLGMPVSHVVWEVEVLDTLLLIQIHAGVSWRQQTMAQVL